jgi:hypothetical protein
VTEFDGLWGKALQQVIGLAAHEVKDALNGVSLNLEVLRSRLSAGRGDANSLESFATAASDQLETLTARIEAVLFLSRPHRGDAPADVAITLKQLAVLLVPAARADGMKLQVEGYDVAVPTSAPPTAVRLVLASGLLALIKEGGAGGVAYCKLQTDAVRAETVVRFSHESAAVGDLDPALASALGKGTNIRVRRSDNDLQLVFPGNT